MFLLNDKIKYSILGLTLLGISSLVLKGIYDYTIYNDIKDIKRKLRKNTWEYYD